MGRLDAAPEADVAPRAVAAYCGCCGLVLDLPPAGGGLPDPSPDSPIPTAADRDAGTDAP